MTGYDMATGLGTPVASELASGLTASRSPSWSPVRQAYGGIADLRHDGKFSRVLAPRPTT